MTDVFVSYNRDDRPIARRYAESFEREGFSVWWDQALNPGEAFDQVTEHALEEARAVVVLWSKTSVNSRWVRAEATQANASDRLVPVMIEPCRRPIIFELTQTVDLTEWDGSPDDPAWQSLVASVRRVVQRSPPGASIAPTGAPSSEVGVSPPVSAPVRPKARAEPAPPASKPLPGVPRRRALLFGASALGLTAAGITGGVLFERGRGRGAGPTAASPSFQRLTYRRGLIRSARLAPDGQTILYGALWDGEPCRVYSTRIDNPESRALDLPNANVLAVSRSGDLALSLGPNEEGVFTYGTLARAPIAGGAPRELVEHVKFADWSPDGSELAIIRSVDGVDRLEYPLGTIRVQPKPGEGTGLGFVRVAPDGRTLAFVHYHAPQSLVGKVCVVDASGKVATLTDEYVNVHGLVWQGAELWYSASDDRPLFRSIMAVKPGVAPRIVSRMPVNVTVWDAAADGRVLIAQTDDRAAMIGHLAGEAQDRDLSWLDASWVADLSRDGREVLFSETGQGVHAEPAAYLRGADGSPAVRLGSGRPLALSPDARWALILASAGESGDSTESIDIVPTGAGESRRLPALGMNYFNARWLPDGLAFVVQAAEQGRKPRLYRWELPEGQPVAVTPEGAWGWAVSPDGSMVAVTGAVSAIQLHRFDGGAVIAVPQTTGADRLLAWIDAGLLVMRGGDRSAPRGQVHLLDPASGRRRPWANILPRDSAGIMAMVSFVATPDGLTHVFTWHRALSNVYLADGLV